jgi:hypothetical protein
MIESLNKLEGSDGVKVIAIVIEENLIMGNEKGKKKVPFKQSF